MGIKHAIKKMCWDQKLLLRIMYIISDLMEWPSATTLSFTLRIIAS